MRKLSWSQNWDIRFLELAKFIASWSHDPSTQTGAVIVDNLRRIISTGYNGFPIKCFDNLEDYNNREVKYSKIVHCEANVIVFARRDLQNCTLYTWPFQSCSSCAKLVIQSGITRCVAPEIPEHLKARWEKDMKIATSMFEEADVDIRLYNLNIKY